MNEQQLIDIDWLKSQYRGNMKELLKIYLKENDECMIRINKDLENHDHDDLRAVAHKMKGSSRIVGAFVIEKLAHHIESIFDPKDLEMEVERLQATYQQLKDEIRLFLDK